MPATGPGEAPPVVRRRARRVRRREARVERQRQSQQARAQQTQHVSQGKAVASTAYRQKPVAARRVEVKRARRERTPDARQVRRVHRERHRQDVKDTREKGYLPRVKRRTEAAYAYTPVILPTNEGRAAGGLHLEPGVTYKGPNVTPIKARRAEKWKRIGDVIIGGGRAAGKALEAATDPVGKIAGTPTYSPKARKVVRNIPADVAELAVTTPSGVAKLASTAAHDPKRAGKMLVEPYKELAREPGKFFEERPVSTLLMVAPAPRGVGRAAGRVARRKGKQTLERPAATLPGSNLREQRTGSRDVVVRAVQARRDRRDPEPVMTEGQVNRRVDEFFGAGQKHMQRVEQAAARQARQRGMTPEQAAEHVEGARAGAEKHIDTRFEQEFGPEIPEYATQRLRHHRAVGSTQAVGARVLRTSRRAFSQTVLPFSPKWLTGQAVEAGLRSMIAGAGPTSYVRAGRVVRALEREQPGAGKQLLERAAPGGLYSRAIGGEMSRAKLGDEFAGTRLAGVAGALTKMGAKPGPRQIRTLHRAVTSFVFDTLNGKIIEGTAQRAMLGKALKQSPLMEHSVIGLSDRAIADAAKGLHATEAQVQLGRQVQRMYGKYSNFSPDVREAIMHWTPFAPWYGNVARFLFKTLPADHPVTTALLADTQAATEEWRKAAGLSTRAPHVPDYLLGSYPAGEGQLRRVGRYTPASPSNIPDALADLFLPQFSGAYKALQGQKWTGEPLHGKFGPEATQTERALAAAVQLVESMVPGVGVTHRAIEQGPRRTFDPTAPTRRPEVKRKTKTTLELKPPISLYPGFEPLE